MQEHEHNISGGSESGSSGDGALPRRAEPSPEPEAGEVGTRSLLRRVAATTAIVLAATIGAMIVLFVLFILALQTNWGGGRFADFLLGISNPFNETVTSYERMTGNFITRVELHDLRILRLDTIFVDTIRTDPPVIRHVPIDSIRMGGAFSLEEGWTPEARTGPLAAFDTMLVDTVHLAIIDTFRVRHNLLALLIGKVHVREIFFSNPVLRAHQQPDSTWDLLEPFKPDTVETGRSRFTFQVDNLRITGGDLKAMYLPPGRDSLFQVEAFNLLARDILVHEELNFVVDTLRTRYALPGQLDWTVLRGGGSLEERMLDITGLDLTSPRSQVTAQGAMLLPGSDDDDDDDPIRNIDFELTAAPIAFEDIHYFVRGLSPKRSASLNLRLGGTSRLLEVDLGGQLSDGGSLDFEGLISPDGDGPVEYAVTGEVRQFNPMFFTSPEDDTGIRLNGDFNLDLAGTNLRELDGRASLGLFDSQVLGISLTEASASALFDDGEARSNLRVDIRGSVVTAEGRIRPFDESPTYTFSGGTRGFNIASLTQGGSSSSSINATFEVDGSGFDAETASLEAGIRVQPSSINNYRIDDGRVRLRLAAGDMSYGLRFLFPDGLIVAEGDAQLQDPIRYVVRRGRFENVDLAALLGQDRRSSLTGTFSLRGVGTDPQSMRLAAVLDVAPSTYGRIRLRDGDASVDLVNGRLSMLARADMADAGRFDFAAVTRPFDRLPTLNVTRGQFERINIGPLLDMPDQNSNLSGSVNFAVSGFDTGTMRLDGTLRLTPSTINQQEINAADIDVTLRQGALALDGDVDFPGGDLTLVATARPFGAVPTYSVTEGRFRGVNLAAFTGNAELESNLNGTFIVEGSGFDAETMHLEGRVGLSSSRLNEQEINAATAAGTLSDGVFDVDVSLDIPEGESRFTATIRPFQEVPTYTIHEGAFAGLDLGALTGNPNLRTNLTGTIALEGQGFDLETATADGQITLTRSVINDASIERAEISGSLQNGLLQFETTAAFDGGSADVRGTGRFFQEVPEYDLAGTLVNLDIGNILGSDTLQARVTANFDVTGRGTDPETMTLRGRIASSDAFYEGADIETLYADFALTEGVLDLDSLLLESSAGDVRGRGRVALFDTTTASDFRFAADIDDIRPFRTLVAARQLDLEEGFIEGRVYGRPGTLRFDAQARLRSFRYNDIRLGEFEGIIAGEIGRDRTLTLAEIEGDLGALSLPQILVRESQFSISYDRGAVVFDGTFRIDDQRAGDVRGRVDTRPEAQVITLEELTLDLDEDQWELLQEATITYGQRIRVRNLLLYSDDQQIALDGVIDPQGLQNLVFTVENFRLDAVADLLGYEGLGGRLNGSVMLTGPAESPELDGELTADLVSVDEPVGNLDLDLFYENLRLNVEALLTHQDGTTLTVNGFIPLDLRLTDEGTRPGVETARSPETSIQLAVAADSFAVGWIRPFLDPESVNRFEGRLTADVDVTGTLEDPNLDGSARFVNGLVGLPVLGVNYRNIVADFTLVDNQVQVQRFTMRSEGSLTGSGTIDLQELTLGEFNIDLVASGFRAVDSEEYTADVSGNMQLSGTTRSPILRGNLRIDSGEINITEATTSPELEVVELTVEDLQTVERRFGLRVTEADTTTFQLYNALALELNVEIDRDTWVRSRANPVMDIEFIGRLDITKQPNQDPQLFGTIEVRPDRSRINQLGRRFQITSGTLTFNGPADDPYVDIDAEYRPRSRNVVEEDVIITLSAEGQFSQQLDLELGSRDPPNMEMTDILSYIATGLPASETLQLSGVEQVGTGLALGQLALFVEEIAGEGLGLDVIQIEQDGFRGTTITAGKYLGSRLFVSVSQPISFGGEPTAFFSPEEQGRIFTLEYEIRRSLLARIMQRGSILRLNLQFETAY